MFPHEMIRAWKENQITERRKAFLWTRHMLKWLRIDALENFKIERLTPDKPKKIANDPNILQWIVYDPVRGALVHYNRQKVKSRQAESLRVLAEDAPSLQDVMQKAKEYPPGAIAATNLAR